MHFYVAGPMRGKPRWNFDAFDNARDLLLAYGHTVVSPADLDRAQGVDPDKMTEADITPAFIAQAARADLWAVQTADAVYMLEGWEYSNGARAEHAVACWLGKEIFYEMGAHRLPFAEIKV